MTFGVMTVARGNSRVFADEASARRGNHDGVNHDVDGAPVFQAFGDGFDDGSGGDHAYLDRCRGDVLEDGVNLLRHEFRRGLLHGTHAGGVLGGERGDGSLREKAVGCDGLDIRLDARAAARIRASDGKDGGDGFRLHGASLSFAAATCG